MLGENHVEPSCGGLRLTKLSIEHAQADDLGAGKHAAKRGRGFDAVQHRETQVQDDQSRGVFPGCLDGRDSVASLVAGLDRSVPCDELANGTAHGGAVIDHEDSGHRHGGRDY